MIFVFLKIPTNTIPSRICITVSKGCYQFLVEQRIFLSKNCAIVKFRLKLVYNSRYEKYEWAGTNPKRAKKLILKVRKLPALHAWRQLLNILIATINKKSSGQGVKLLRDQRMFHPLREVPFVYELVVLIPRYHRDTATWLFQISSPAGQSAIVTDK